MNWGRQPIPRLRRIGGAMCALLLVMPACTPQQQAAPPARESAVGRPYAIGRGDTLEVLVWGEEKLSGPVPVRPDGMVTVALIGDVPAAGRTPDDLAADIQASLTKYVDQPNVVVRVSATGSRRFYVIGNVRAPGAFDMNADQTLLQALAMAGGVNEFASTGSVRVIRVTANGPIEPDYDAILKGEEPDIRLEPGDTIVVP